MKFVTGRPDSDEMKTKRKQIAFCYHLLAFNDIMDETFTDIMDHLLQVLIFVTEIHLPIKLH